MSDPQETVDAVALVDGARAALWTLRGRVVELTTELEAAKAEIERLKAEAASKAPAAAVREIDQREVIEAVKASLRAFREAVEAAGRRP